MKGGQRIESRIENACPELRWQRKVPLINNFVLWRDLAVVTAGSMIIFFLIIAVATGGENLASLLWVAGLVLCIMAALMVIATLVLWVLTLRGPEAEFSISSRESGTKPENFSQAETMVREHVPANKIKG